jgi:hypothetical protein
LASPFDGGLMFPAEEPGMPKLRRNYSDAGTDTGECGVAGSAFPDVAESLDATRKRLLKKPRFRANGTASVSKKRG